MSLLKRRRLDLDSLEDALPDIIGEIDLEICIRERLAKTLESRITWALTLRESLQSDRTGSTTSFKDVAIDTLSAIEAPSEFLFVREATPAPQAFPQHTQRPSRPPPKPKLPTRNPNTTFLYIRSADLEPPHDENHIQTYLLRCPTCFRTTFTSLQGLLNHARITHSQEWGSHDECVRACAVVDPGMDISAGIEVGLGPAGILPGLRSLFQRAVGAHSANRLLAETDNVTELPGSQPSQEPTSGLHLARTLGLHKDTPALAQFLGKQAIRRGIKEWDDGGVVDIDGLEDDAARSAVHDTTNNRERNPTKGRKSKRWRMAYMHRNDVEHATVDSRIVVLHSDEQNASDNIHSGLGAKSLIAGNTAETRSSKLALAPGIGLSTLGTRFHFVARIIITDRSLWIPLDRRQNTGIDHTHMWMISIDSPSYSHHITTILQRMTVTSLTHPGDFPALTKSDPPFAVIGTTDEPFLAKVEMCFSGAPDANGQMASQTMVLEHWVELDLVKLTTPTMGEEQVVDIELDKATVLMPVRRDYTPVDAKVLWSLDNSQVGRNDDISKDRAQAEPTEGYGKILTSLLRQFPMTLKDTPRGRPPNPPLPYKLVSNSAQLKNLLLGRRKAIEWGRARALRDAYIQAIQDPQMTKENAIQLTTADVFIWLSEEGHFLKRPAPTPKPMKPPVENKPVESWCPICGQGVDAHLTVDAVKKEAADPSVKAHTTIKDETKEDVRSGSIQAPAFPYSCGIVPAELHTAQIPIVDVQALLGPLRHPPQIHYDVAASRIDDALGKVLPSHRSRATHLVAACDPQMCLAVERIITPLKLPAFACSLPEHSQSQSSPQYPLDMLGADKATIESRLAPYAMLGLATQQFVRALIKGGLEVAKGEKAIVAGLAVPKRRRKIGKEKDSAVSMLTPAHIMNSIVSHGRGRRLANREVDVAMLGCLGRLRVPVDRGADKIGKYIPEDSTVKTEQP